MSAKDHFTTEQAGVPTAAGRYVTVASLAPVNFLPGLEFRPVLAESTMVNFVSFAPRTSAPLHSHVEEQIVLVLDGEFEFNLDGEVRIMHKGDVAVIPPWVPHGARTLDATCVEVDIFNPPRQSLLAHTRGEQRDTK